MPSLVVHQVTINSVNCQDLCCSANLAGELGWKTQGGSPWQIRRIIILLVIGRKWPLPIISFWHVPRSPCGLLPFCSRDWLYSYISSCPPMGFVAVVVRVDISTHTHTHLCVVSGKLAWLACAHKFVSYSRYKGTHFPNVFQTYILVQLHALNKCISINVCFYLRRIYICHKMLNEDSTSQPESKLLNEDSISQPSVVGYSWGSTYQW